MKIFQNIARETRETHGKIKIFSFFRVFRVFRGQKIFKSLLLATWVNLK